MTQISDMDKELITEFVSESLDGIGELDEKFVELEQEPTNKPNLDAIFRSIHSIKGNSGFFNLNSIKKLSHQMENLLDQAREGHFLLNSQSIDLLLKGVDFLKSRLQNLLSTYTDTGLSDDEEKFLEELEKIQSKRKNLSQDHESLVRQLENLIQKYQPKDSDRTLCYQDLCEIFNQLESENFEQKQAEAKQAASEVSSTEKQPIEAAAQETIKTEVKSEETPAAPVQKAEMVKTMRIDERTIDGFMQYIGELIIASEVFDYLQTKLEKERISPELAREFKSATFSFNELSTDLQKSLMEIRKVPLKTLYSKAPRLVRDLASDLNKKIKLETEGDQIQIDKSLVEVLEDPFVHMLRNAVDHGLEDAETRAATDKGPEGHVWIRAHCDKKFIHFIIEDDGKGIDPEKIKEIALKKKVITSDELNHLTEQEVLRLIFKPGFSSAEQVSEVSGRGVGMDVVLTNIENAGGEVFIESTLGKGTRFHLQLPLTVTLIVIKGLLVRNQSEYFILPIDYICEVAHTKEEDINTVADTNRFITIRDRVLPLKHLNQILSLNQNQNQFHQQQTIVVVEKAKKQMAIAVDELLGLKQVVLKDIGEEFKSLNKIAGGAILGDGRVGLVLDVEGMLEESST